MPQFYINILETTLKISGHLYTYKSNYLSLVSSKTIENFSINLCGPNHECHTEIDNWIQIVDYPLRGRVKTR